MEVDQADHEADTSHAMAWGLARHSTTSNETKTTTPTDRGQFTDQRSPAKMQNNETDKQHLPKIVIKPVPPPRTSGLKLSNSYKCRSSKGDREQKQSTSKAFEQSGDATGAVSESSEGATGSITHQPAPGGTHDKRFRCHLCPFATTTKGYLARHLNKRHPFTSHPRQGYDPKQHAQGVGDMTSRDTHLSRDNKLKDRFDLTPRPLKCNLAQVNDNRDHPSKLTSEEPIDKSPKVEPYVSRYVANREKASPTLIPLDSQRVQQPDP